MSGEPAHVEFAARPNRTGAAGRAAATVRVRKAGTYMLTATVANAGPASPVAAQGELATSFTVRACRPDDVTCRTVP